MADSTQLSTGTSSGTQATTQDPQNSVQPNNGASQTSDVQPGTATSLLNTSSGIPLHVNDVPTVSLAAVTTTGKTTVPPVIHHHPNPVLLGFSILLFVVAIALFRATANTAKNTTK